MVIGGNVKNQRSHCSDFHFVRIGQNIVLTVFAINAISFLLSGFNIYGSSLFTALKNGLISAVISFVRTLICQVAALILLPMIWELDGIWLAIVAAELVALLLTAFFVIKYRKRYGYL